MNQPKQVKRIYFTDFDGTITKKDTTNALVKAFARDGWQRFLRQWEQGTLSTEECSRLIFAYLEVSTEEAERFLRTIPFDETFRDFVAYVEARKEKIYILSDGFDFNIETVMQKVGITQLPTYTNHLLIKDNHTYDLTCPYTSGCGKCGTCKKTLVEKLKKEAAPVQAVYIGDGISDHCGCQAADLIFAKGRLWQYCREKQIPALPFRTFADIKKYLEKNPVENQT